MSSYVHIDNKKKDILILGIDPTRGLDDAKLTAEAQYSRSNRKFLNISEITNIHNYLLKKQDIK